MDPSRASIETIAAEHPYWIERAQTQDEAQQKAKRRSAFSTLFNLTDEAIQSLDNGADWLSIKQRLKTLLNLLETEGCFVLRKGAIESYFAFNTEEGVASKPEAAAIEAAELIEADAEDVGQAYDDIARCLRFASAAEKIVEAEALQEVLLEICASALAKIRAGKTDANLNAIARSITPELAGMFDLQAADGKLQISLESKVLDVEGLCCTNSLRGFTL